MFSSDAHEGFGGAVPAAPSAGRSSPALRNALLLALFFAYAVGVSFAFESALATTTPYDDPDRVTVAGG